MSKPGVTVFVCTSCRRPRETLSDICDFPGRTVLEELPKRLTQEADYATVRVVPVECLAVCKRPATIALSGEGRWMYLIGDLDPECHLDEIASAVRAYAATENGFVPWRDRPPAFRRGVIARIPPLGFDQTDKTL
jgi:predicted metal-binding protein